MGSFGRRELNLPIAAVAAVGADEPAIAVIVDDDLVEIRIGRAATTARAGAPARAEGMVLESNAGYGGIGRDRIDPLLAAGAEEFQAGRAIELGIVELRNRRGRRQIAPIDHHGIVAGRGGFSMP